jgi:SAM-dependent methyltransferase
MSSATTSADSSVFDAVAASYEAALDEGLRLSGEGPDYFARRRIAWTARLLDSERIASVLDFGCGVGLAAPRLAESFQPEVVWGYDPSAAAVERARRNRGDAVFRFTASVQELPAGEFDLTYCNGVFHHIPLERRGAALATVQRCLRPGGWFALWENNPWNPGTRWVMSRIPFDRDAATLSPVAARRTLRAAGFRVLRTDGWFLFPHVLRWLRPLESLVHRLPLGGQYLVLAQKPHTEASR